MAIEILKLTLGPLQTNCYVLACTATGEAVVIDPAWDGRGIAKAVADHGRRLSAIWLTHARSAANQLLHPRRPGDPEGHRH